MGAIDAKLIFESSGMVGVPGGGQWSGSGPTLHVPGRAKACQGAGARALLLARALVGALADLAVHGGPRQRRGNAPPNYGAAGAAAWRGGDAVLYAPSLTFFF